jgi:tetratricopeptide (TPR) repeat protein
VDIPDMDGNEFSSPEFSVEEEEVYTESMVNIYIKQGRYQQALEILRKISLNNPKKSSNFAAQIYLLEVLLKENK